MYGTYSIFGTYSILLQPTLALDVGDEVSDTSVAR
jgi:hypothetical protein